MAPTFVKPSKSSPDVPKRAEPPTDDGSRLAVLARPAARGFAPSKAELEKQYMEKSRAKMAEQRKRNEKSCYDAIHAPQVDKTVPSRELTVPKEFNLSACNTPSRSRCTTPAASPARSRCTTPLRSRSGSVCSDMSIDEASVGGRGRGRTPNRPLTVARGPNLMTALRPRSLSNRANAARGAQSSGAGYQGGTFGTPGRSSSFGTPLRSSTRSHSRKASSSPARSAFALNTGHGMVTPRRQSSRTRHDTSCGSLNSDMELSVPASVRSRLDRSCDSRASIDSRLSQRSCSRHVLSTDEIAQIHISAKRSELKELMKQNEKRGRQAILYPTPSGARRSTSLTVPREFNLSVSNTPCRSVCMSEAGSDCGDDTTQPWDRSLRSSRSVPASPARAAWAPELTVPEGPSLLTEHRSRSTSSALRSASGTPSKRSMSRHRLPREQAAIERHFDRAAAAQSDTAAPYEANKPAWNMCASLEGSAATEEDEWVRAAPTPEERAKRAREVVERKYNEKAAEKAAQLKCFTNAPRHGRTGKASTSTHEAAKQTKQ